jgi:hypothetical protein
MIMTKRHAARGARSTGSRRKQTPTSRSGKRPTAKRQLSRSAAKARKRPAVKKAAPRKQAAVKPPSKPRRAPAARKRAHLERPRRTVEESVPTPPSSLDMDRHGSAVRTGRAVMAETLRDHRGMSPDITAGDVDVDVEDAYFTGEEAPGGDNSTPDQDIVDDIGRALGLEYQDNEPLKGSDKLIERDKHRWELDPASSEDYKERKGQK